MNHLTLRLLFSGSPYVLLPKTGWRTISSGHYKNLAKWRPQNAIDDNPLTFYGSFSPDTFHWIQIDFGVSLQVMEEAINGLICTNKTKPSFIF